MKPKRAHLSKAVHLRHLQHRLLDKTVFAAVGRQDILCALDCFCNQCHNEILPFSFSESKNGQRTANSAQTVDKGVRAHTRCKMESFPKQRFIRNWSAARCRTVPLTACLPFFRTRSTFVRLSSEKTASVILSRQSHSLPKMLFRQAAHRKRCRLSVFVVVIFSD